MKSSIQTTKGVKATFSFEGGYEEIFAARDAALVHVTIMQDGDYLLLPASDFRAFLTALSEWADQAGI